MNWTNRDTDDLIRMRHELHRYPEISGQEHETARRVVGFMQADRPDQILTGLGGAGVAALFRGQEPGPTVVLRCELDGLPIAELSQLEYRSQNPGRGHLCGHDGHMSVLLAMARLLGRQRPKRGRVMLLFQPAEETGAGAAAVIRELQRLDLMPDMALALHNVPGLAIGQALLRPGPVNCASRGMEITLQGRSSHASNPEDGIAPTAAIAHLLDQLPALGMKTPPPAGAALGDDFALLTVTHCQIGTQNFGIAPDHAALWVTLRSIGDAGMAQLVSRAEACVHQAADRDGLRANITYHETFSGCVNDPEMTKVLNLALSESGQQVCDMQGPMRWSEDFGQFALHGVKTAMFFPGSGREQPQLHNPDYDFPDEMILDCAAVFRAALAHLLGAFVSA